jgi:hypothetical protein
MFAGVNENFISAAAEGDLVMAKESVDLDAFQDVAAESRSDISPIEWDVQRAARAISKKMVALFRTKLHEVTADA